MKNKFYVGLTKLIAYEDGDGRAVSLKSKVSKSIGRTWVEGLFQAFEHQKQKQSKLKHAQARTPLILRSCWERLTQKLKIKRKKKEKKTKKKKLESTMGIGLPRHVTFAPPPNPFFFQFTSWLCLHVPPFLPCPPFFYKHPCQEPHNLEHILQTQLTYPSLPTLLLQTRRTLEFGAYITNPTHISFFPCPPFYKHPSQEFGAYITNAQLTWQQKKEKLATLT